MVSSRVTRPAPPAARDLERIAAAALAGGPALGDLLAYLGGVRFATDLPARIMLTQPTHLLGCWPLNDPVGTAATNISPAGAARNGVYKGAGEPLVGQLLHPFVAPKFDGSNDYANLYSASLAGAWNGGEFSVLVYLRPRNGPVWGDVTTRRMVYIAADASNRIVIQKAGTAGGQMDVVYTAGGTAKSVSISNIVSAGWLSVGATVSKTADQFKVYRNGLRTGSVQTGLGTWAGSLASTLVVAGAADTSGTNPWDGYVAYVAVWDTPLSDAEMLALGVMPREGQIIFDGDSWTVGKQANAVPYPLVATQAIGGNWRATSVAVSGQTVATMTTNAPTNVDTLIDAAQFPRNVVVMLGGINDIAGSADAATTYARIVAYHQARRAAGWKTVACTIPHATAASVGGAAFNPVADAVNALIRANWGTFADALADLAADSRLQDATDTTYYNADELHGTTAGYAVVGAIVGAALATL